MAAVRNFSNLLTLIIFNGFSLQANRRGGGGRTCCSRAAPVNSSFLNCRFRAIIQKGNYCLIGEINETLNSFAASWGTNGAMCSPVGGAGECQGPLVGKEGHERHQGWAVGDGWVCHSTVFERSPCRLEHPVPSSCSCNSLSTKRESFN